MKQNSHKQLKKKLLSDPDFFRSYKFSSPATEIGWRVRRLRLASGLSQAELARRLNTKQSSIARLESGLSGLPSLSFLDKIARTLGVRLVLPAFEVAILSNKSA